MRSLLPGRRPHFLARRPSEDGGGRTLAPREDDARRALAARFNFPYLPEPGPLSRDVVLAYAPFTEQAEAVRSLRAQLELLHFGVGRRSLAFVSSRHGDGRSYVAANLAIAFAQLRVPTLLVDADLRRPAQHRLFGVDADVGGLAWVLAGGARPEEVIVPVDGFPCLHLLPAGVVPPSPSELLGHARLASLLDHLSKGYEVILVDTPAWRGSADAQLVAAQCEGALAVVRRGTTPVRSLARMARALHVTETALVGVALNQPPNHVRRQWPWR